MTFLYYDGKESPMGRILQTQTQMDLLIALMKMNTRIVLLTMVILKFFHLLLVRVTKVSFIRHVLLFPLVNFMWMKFGLVVALPSIGSFHGD